MSVLVDTRAYNAYAIELEEMVRHALESRIMRSRWYPHLNGHPYEAARKLVPQGVRKQKGIFFTGNQLAAKVAERLANLLQGGGTVRDPACGAGDLLLACAKYLPIADTLADTLELWSEKIIGNDISSEFVRTTRARLILFALDRHRGEVARPVGELESYFTRIKVANSYDASSEIATDCIVTNPPFSHVPAPETCEWAHGKVQEAAIFIMTMTKGAHDGKRLVAILPEVLRSGARYKKWREMIGKSCRSLSVNIVGRFDPHTDVDVFLMDAELGTVNNGTWPVDVESPNYEAKVSDFFDIITGPVVPYRDPQKGNWAAYVDVKLATPWKEIILTTHRRFQGTLIDPPFVVVRRTSSPSDRFRATASIITAARPVAVENHLLVLKPKKGGLKSARFLLKQLKDERTNEWLNNNIRCRHLTVGALGNLPLWEKIE